MTHASYRRDHDTVPDTTRSRLSDDWLLSSAEDDEVARDFADERDTIPTKLVSLIVEYAWRGPSDSYASTKLEAVRRRVDGLLRSLELGIVTGLHMDASIMRVCCAVFDRPTARRVITADLAGSGFADFRRIADGDDE